MDPKKLTCIICRGSLIVEGASKSKSSGVQASAVVCGHVFHTSCLHAWLRRNATCPNCRHPVRSENDIIDKLYFDEDDEEYYSDATDSGQVEGASSGLCSKVEEPGFGVGMIAGAVLTGLAVGIGYLFFGNRQKRNN